MRNLIAVAMALTLGACASYNKLAAEVEAPAAESRILLVKPDVQLSLLGAAGLPEPRADWSQSARENLQASVQTYLEGKSLQPVDFDPESAMGGRGGQILRLNQAVVATIIATEYLALPLPTKKDSFDWTLGEGAQEIGRTTGANYALFVTGVGSYASGGRWVAAVGFAALGVGIPMGAQEVRASLVDLRSGKVVWFNVAPATGADMREPEGADKLIETLMKDSPFA